MGLYGLAFEAWGREGLAVDVVEVGVGEVVNLMQLCAEAGCPPQCIAPQSVHPDKTWIAPRLKSTPNLVTPIPQVNLRGGGVDSQVPSP